MVSNGNKKEIQELIENLQSEKGSVEQAEIWLLRLQEINPFFYDSDSMLSLRDLVMERRKAEQLRSQIGEVNTKEKLIELVKKIDYSTVSSREDILELDAYRRIFRESVPHPRADQLISTLGREKTAEEIVEEALSYKGIQLP